jgi:uncharacterized protein with PIN domain
LFKVKEGGDFNHRNTRQVFRGLKSESDAEIGQKGVFSKGLRGVLMETKFIADSMLGKLAKWLRVLGYDTLYQTFYEEGAVAESAREGRKVLSRHKPTITRYTNSVLIHSDHVKDQLYELKNGGTITSDRSEWFSRCLLCNIPLEETKGADARENVPEYVFYQSASEIRFCPSCGRYFWPGSHRERMVRQLEEWGL